MELDNKQKEIIESNYPKIIVVAGSGSGKTKVLTEKIRYIINNGNNPKDIVAITFTNVAAEEVRDRLGKIAKDCFIGTIHSYANKLLLMNGFDTNKFINEEKFDKFFTEIKKHPEVIEPVNYLLIDEYQDIDQFQYQFFEMINAKHFFAVGDDWQNIYEWRGSKAIYFKNLVKNPNFKVFKMGNNYRSGENIVRFGMNFLRSVEDKIQKNISCQNPEKGIVEEINYNSSFIIKEIQKEKNYGKWFILVRKNAQGEQIMTDLKRNNIPFDSFKKSNFTNDEIKVKLKENTVKVLTVHSAKGLENDNIIVIGVHPNTDEEKRVAYVAATRARKRLIWCYEKMPSWKNKQQIYNWE